MNDKQIMKKFKKLGKDIKQEIRIKYRQAHLHEYKHSIYLFIVYVLLGIIGLIGLYIALTSQFLWGFIIYVVSFICLILFVFFLKKSNKPFYKYLRRVLKKY